MGLLNDVEPEVRCAAALGVASVATQIGDRDAALAALVPSIEALSRDGSQQVRAALASSVGDLAPALGRDATVARVLPVLLGAAQESEIPNFKGSDLGRFPLVSADFWTRDHLSERSRSVNGFSGTRARGIPTLKRR